MGPILEIGGWLYEYATPIKARGCPRYLNPNPHSSAIHCLKNNALLVCFPGPFWAHLVFEF
ncbi:MAG: hypothetical protein EBZ47_07880 [Chlamydiae bacterium]|nr:hypothetical protein [Chlamydiota bacterium]